MTPAGSSRPIGLVIALAFLAALAGCGPVMSGQGRSSAPAESVYPVQAQPVGGVYTVVGGDTIYVVARKFGVTVRGLIDANRLQPPFQLEPGQILHLPTGGDYVVVKGDTLAKIAHKTGVEFAALARMNNLSSPYRIRVGQHLILPAGTTAPSNSNEVITASGTTTVIQSPNAGQPGVVNAAPVAPMTVETLSAPQSPPRETTTFGAATRPGLVPGASTASAPPPPSSAALSPPVVASPSVPSAPPPPPNKPGAPSVPAAATALPPVPPVPSALPPVEPAPASGVQTAAATPAHLPANTPAFIWPVHGPVLATFGTMAKGQENPGINIAVPRGTPVMAAADGEVVYAGNELRGYGNLLLIKHTGTDYITAYGQNAKLLVKQGQHVHRGEEIAVSGDTGGVSQPQVHFEVRQGVKAIDPQTVLPSEQ